MLLPCVPSIRRNADEAGRAVQCVVLRPGEHPFGELRMALARRDDVEAERREQWITTVEDKLKTGGDALPEVTALDELLVRWDERTEGRVLVVMTVRLDFVGTLLQYEAFKAFYNGGATWTLGHLHPTTVGDLSCRGADHIVSVGRARFAALQLSALWLSLAQEHDPIEQGILGTGRPSLGTTSRNTWATQTRAGGAHELSRERSSCTSAMTRPKRGAVL